MKYLIVYDSLYGNTEKIAMAISQALGSEGEGECLRVGEVKSDNLADLQLFVVGSPTQRLRATEAINSLLNEIPKNSLAGIKVAAFDTRYTDQEIRETSRVLDFVVKLTGGFAAKPIADQLVRKGGRLVVPPEGFFVNGAEGPLKDGELERAAEWGKILLTSTN